MTKKSMRFLMCKLVKPIDTKATRIQVSWIPEKYAIVNKVLELKMPDGWENGWTVMEVYPEKHVVEIVEARERDYKHQRKVSDV